MNIKEIAIIGAGPSGLAVARALIAETVSPGLLFLNNLVVHYHFSSPCRRAQELYVTTRSPGKPQKLTRHYFKAVGVATGHYDKPFVTEAPGWRIVGNGSLGLDSSVQIVKAGGDVWWSFDKSLSPSSKDSSATGEPDNVGVLIKNWGKIHDKPVIQRFGTAFGTVHFYDGSVLTNMDYIIYCTGYLYSFPFLDQFNSDCKGNPDSCSTYCVVTTNRRINCLYKQIFYLPHSSLTFLVMNKFVVPFPMAESQAALVARVYSARAHLPVEPQM
ncbi:hypothetical protein NADFUDRAFT_52538 [Nadsonia fulvescens var. elongata DSM 6958]|uniref:FAD/NAD(P)-binding domain-containing protein n=1 Tax=Nadsonia fulvescens var. elongata DSM 6958 TaxID=857566 RepID=A0A1E3PFM7_9ASCO|nr:hypothetical protein NADFUDRAFT_52538 [Nadsonia fulvescens var. elongata DSM 6958]